MEKVACKDTHISKWEKRMTAREALLHEQFARLAAAKVALEELHDGGELATMFYYPATTELTRCMGKVDELIGELQRETELKWPAPNVDTNSLIIPSRSGGCFEITRLRVMP